MIFDWSNIPEDFTEIPAEERDKALANSRMADRVAKILQVNRLQIADKTEQMVAEVAKNCDTILAMKTTILILLFAFPAFAQPCSTEMRKAGKIALEAVKQFRPAFKNPQVSCSPAGELILSVQAKLQPQRLVDLMKEKIEVALAGKGISRVIIEGRYWDRYETGNVHYSVTPVQVITTRTRSTTISTVTGGHVVESGRYGYKNGTVVAVIDY